MAVDNFIPEMWASRMATILDKSLVYGALCNRFYEGEIAEAGDTVRINAVGPVTVAAYTKNVTVINPQTLNDQQAVLSITQSDYFAFEVDDIDARQAKGNVLVAGMDRAAYALRDTADQYVAGLYTGASSISAAPIPVNSVNVLAQTLVLAEALDTLNVPTEGRWLVIPPWVKTKFVLAKVLLENTTNTALDNGFVGRIAGFNVYVSNNVPTTNGGTEFKIMAGTSEAITFADCINKVEAYRPESAFSDAVKGLHVYGARVICPDALAVGDWTNLAEPV